MKTVLAPNAPWPVWRDDGKPKKPPPKPKPAPKPKKAPSKIKKTDEKFTEWAKRNGVKR